MQWLSELFETLDLRIQLDQTRKSRIKSAFSSLSTFVKDDGPLSKVALDVYLQGSVASDTAIKPIDEDGEFDVDAVLVIDISKLPTGRRTPSAVIEWIATRLRQCRHFEGKVHERPRCVRIEYFGEFHIDVVPAYRVGPETSVIFVPDKASGWRRSNPKGYLGWCANIDEKTNGLFSRETRLYKYWRDVTFGEDSKPKSILMTTLVGQRIPLNTTSAAEAFVLVLESLAADLTVLRSVPNVPNPSLPEEDLARDWTAEAFATFTRRVQTKAREARKALRASGDDRDRGTRLWLEFFGDVFPTRSRSDGEGMRGQIRSGQAFVAPSGLIGKPSEVSGTQIQPHRFYGTENPKTRP